MPTMREDPQNIFVFRIVFLVLLDKLQETHDVNFYPS